MRALAALPLLAGCGFGLFEDHSGGGENLPTLGAGPFGRLEDDFDSPADEPFVVASRTADFADPACLARPGGGYRLWFAMRQGDPDTAAWAIGRAEVGDLHGLPELAPEVVLRADEDGWDQGRIGAPSIVESEDGLVMYFEGGVDEPAIGRATSADGGVTWTRDPAPVLAGARAPGAVLVHGVWHLFYVPAATPGAAIERRTSSDGITWGAADRVVVPRPDLEEAFDGAGVGDPFLLLQESAAGRHHWGLWFTGAAVGEVDAGPGETAVGFAAAFDDEPFRRFAGADPVLTAPAGGPCVVVDGPRAVLFFHEEIRARQGIAAAVHP